MTTQYSHLTAHKYYEKIWPAKKKEIVVGINFFKEVKEKQGYIELSKNKIETDKFIYEVNK